jgi:hypothetical protein
MARDPLEKETDVFNQMNQTIAFNNEQMRAAVASLKKPAKSVAKPAANKAAVNVSKVTPKVPGVGPAVNIAARAAAVAPGIPRSAYDNKSAYQGMYKASAQAAPAAPPNVPAKASTGSTTTVNTAYGPMKVQKAQVGQSGSKAPSKPSAPYVVPKNAAPSKVSNYAMSKNNPTGRNPMAPNTDSRITDISKSIQANKKRNVSAPVPGSSNVTTVRTAYGPMKAEREGTTEGHGRAIDTILMLSSAIPVSAGVGVGVNIARGVAVGVKTARAADVTIQAAKASRVAKAGAKVVSKVGSSPKDVASANAVAKAKAAAKAGNATKKEVKAVKKSVSAFNKR